MRGAVCLLLSLALFCGCAMFPKRVRLRYEASRNVTRRPRETALRVLPFLDKRGGPRRFGDAPVLFGLSAVPIRPDGDPAAWATRGASEELAAAGYTVSPTAEWKLGGALEDVRCAPGKETDCTVKIEAWLTSKDGQEVLRQEYTGDGLRPALLGEDPYEVSLKEGLRDALEGLRKDIARMVP